MNISFEKKITLGFIINLLVVLMLGILYWYRMFNPTTLLMDWIVFILILMSFAMLTVVYVIIRNQLKARKESDWQLKENKNLLQSIIDNTTNPISIKKINGEYILINKQFALLLKLTEPEIIGKTDHDFLNKEVADRYRNADLEAVKSGKEIKIEELIEQPDGLHTYLSVKFPLFDFENRVYAVGSIATDITERKLVELSLEAGERFFRMSRDFLVIASKERFIKISASLSKVLGYTENELLSKPFFEFIFHEDLKNTQTEIEKLQGGEATINFRNRWVCKDGNLKWLSWTATADIETGILYAIARDITEQLKAEMQEEMTRNELYENQQKLSLILENIGDGVMVANSDKQVVLANYMVNELFGIEDDSHLPVNLADSFELYFPDGKTTFPSQNLPMERALVGESTDDIDVVIRHRTTQKKKRVLLSGRPIVDEENHVIAAVITIKDISKYKNLEEELKKTELKYRRAIGFKTDQD
ncbi:MAG TPA: PAS domain S-box protein [Draconibacterium sp.]|nr:PAS domain S-box protein [Draconibacterium sp.]